jgi:DNA-binding transcriptional regulator LsrR (DeoR family)
MFTDKQLAKIEWLLKHTDWDVNRIAKAVGVSYNTFAAYLKKAGKRNGRCLVDISDDVSDGAVIDRAMRQIEEASFHRLLPERVSDP